MRYTFSLINFSLYIATFLILFCFPFQVSGGVLEGILEATANLLEPKKYSSQYEHGSSLQSSSLNFKKESALFSIQEDFINKIERDLNFIVEQTNSNVLRTSAWLEVEHVPSVAKEGGVELEAIYREKGLYFRVSYDDSALKNPRRLIQVLGLLDILISKSVDRYNNLPRNLIFTSKIPDKILPEIESPHAIAEILWNRFKGSPTANLRWFQIQSAIFKNSRLSNQYASKLGVDPNIFSEIHQELEQKIPELEKKARQHLKQQEETLAQWRVKTGVLEKLETMEEKLDDLIMKNDRKGVRSLVESYLPWPLMEPSEINAWKNWLNAIENPDPFNTTVAFRGVKYDTDKVQRRMTPTGEIYGFMSTVLTKNQGSYTRRLRSLGVNRINNGDVGFKEENSRTPSVKITDQMAAHAREPKGSSFISFTYNPFVAKKFIGEDKLKDVRGKSEMVPYGGFLVVKMDSRRLIPNISSMFSYEIELLAPLIIFPDEVLAYHEGSFTKANNFERFIVEISNKTGFDFATWQTAKLNQEKDLQLRYVQNGHEFLKRILETKDSLINCSTIF